MESEIEFTDQYKQQWLTDGYLHIPNVLEPKEIETFNHAVDNLLSSKDNNKINSSMKGNATLGKHSSKTFNILQIIEHCAAFDILLDHPKIFKVITGIMGIFLQVSGCDLFIRKPSTTTSDLNKFHTDGGPSLQKILPNNSNLPILIKVQYFLTDVLTEDAGNFIVIPGSHLNRVEYYDKNCFIHECNTYLNQGIQPPNARQIKVGAGDVVIHIWTLWHAVAKNYSNNIRKSVSIRYSQLWCRPYYFSVSSQVKERLTERQQRLMGIFDDSITPTEYYTPPNQQEIILSNNKIQGECYVRND